MSLTVKLESGNLINKQTLSLHAFTTYATSILPSYYCYCTTVLLNKP